jgi:dTMP kinase
MTEKETSLSSGPQKGTGAFLVFEGGEGTGKTTQIKNLKTWLETQGFDVLLTWEPGGTPLGQKIREMLLDPAIPEMDARCEALLFAAARAEHVAKVIEPAVSAGKIVLCDRYWDASRAYQGSGRQLGFYAIDKINHWGTRSFFPDRVFVFDLDPKEGLARASKRTGGKLDRLEQESLNFHQLVRQAYLHVAQADPKRYSVVQAAQSIEAIQAQLQEEVIACLKAKSPSLNS